MVYFIYLQICVSVYMTVSLPVCADMIIHTRSSKGGFRSLRVKIIGFPETYGLLHKCLGQDYIYVQQVLLTAEPFLQPPSYLFRLLTEAGCGSMRL